MAQVRPLVGNKSIAHSNNFRQPKLHEFHYRNAAAAFELRLLTHFTKPLRAEQTASVFALESSFKNLLVIGAGVSRWNVHARLGKSERKPCIKMSRFLFNSSPTRAESKFFFSFFQGSYNNKTTTKVTFSTNGINCWYSASVFSSSMMNGR